MDIKEIFDGYVKATGEENQNLLNIAYDEMNSDQYEEAAAHFDQLYVKDSTDYMSYFFRAYCKSHCGKRGDVYPDSQKLTSAFTMACKKAFDSGDRFETDLLLLLNYYMDAMDNLAYNAVEEVDSNGHTSNPTKYKIKRMAKENFFTIATENKDVIKTTTELKEFVIGWLKKFEATDLVKAGALIVEYDPAYAATYQEKLKKRKIKKIIGLCIGLGIALAITIAIIVASV